MSLVADGAALAALRPEWHTLWRRTPGATPFQSPDWLLAWWEVFGTSRPRVALRRAADGALEGVLPLYELEGRLLPMGAGLTDWQDALLAPGLGAAAAGELLGEALGRWPLPCDLTDLPEAAALRAAPPPCSWSEAAGARQACPVLRIGAVPARQRRKLRMARHRADRAGGWTVEHATEATLAAALAALIRLHGEAWAARGAAGVFADPRVARFHRLAAPGLWRAGALRLAVLRIAGREAAAAYALLAPGRVSLYLGGWDPALAHCSPGTLLLGALLEEAEAEGRIEAHFLRGAEPYKYAWGAEDRWSVTRLLRPPP